MFIFAEMLAKYLQDQPSKKALLDELDPSKLPVKLDHVYVSSTNYIIPHKTDVLTNCQI